jgi:hypothetical protein
VRPLELAEPDLGRLVVLVAVDLDVVGGVLLPAATAKARQQLERKRENKRINR